MHPFPLSAGEGGLSLLPNFQKGGLGRISVFRDFNETLTLMTEKIYKQKMFFSILTKNLNREILIKNLVTFKRRNWIKDENSNMGIH